MAPRNTRRLRRAFVRFFIPLTFAIGACTSPAAPVTSLAPTQSLILDLQSPPSSATRAALTPKPTSTPMPTGTPTPFETEPLPTPTPDCRDPDGLLILVDHDHPLPEDYKPADLEPLSLPAENTLHTNLRLRAVAVPSLLDLLAAMNKAGVGPTVISAFRSYKEQGYTYQVALTEQPDRAENISAPPGLSEHQLGTAVDFGSWSLGNQFHSDFYETPEGQWLVENARDYGFVLSFPGWAEKVTGYYFEPWHYRYVGIELAQELGRKRLTLIEYLREKEKRGCRVTP